MSSQLKRHGSQRAGRDASAAESRSLPQPAQEQQAALRVEVSLMADPSTADVQAELKEYLNSKNINRWGERTFIKARIATSVTSPFWITNLYSSSDEHERIPPRLSALVSLTKASLPVVLRSCRFIFLTRQSLYPDRRTSAYREAR